MTTFTLATDNNITAHDAPPAAQDNMVAFATEKELTKLSSDWPITRFVEVWNAFAGAPPFGDLKPVKKFTDRKTAVTRIWKAIQALTPAPAPQAAPVAPKKAKATKATTAKDGATEAKTPRDGSKTAQVVALLQRKNGATLAEIMAKMGWLKHTVRGFMAGAMKKAGYNVESFKPERGDRTYRINP